ncbi:MAG: cysteine--tRNA ligase [Anaerolineales bacterium]
MALRIYDTLTRQKREFTPLRAGQVRMYVCGPTVYAKAHVGHAMSAVVFDVIRRYLEHRGHVVTHVMNYTDVEDKILLRARELGVDPMQLAEGYIQEYDAHLKELHVLPASRTPRASQEIPAIVEMIQKLIERGAAYPMEGDVYFRVATDPEYGKLSGRKPEDMRAGARIEIDERKGDPADFALWKAAKPGEPSWPSPWGPGRPGWHIECSAMILRHLGEQIDIHGGGNDLIFPHHENEIAQSETLTGKPFAQFWIHNGMLQFSDEKMSKSLGNVVSVEDFLQRHEGDALRMLVLNSGYRKPLTFSEDAVGQAEANVERLRSAIRAKGRDGDGASPEKAGEISRAILEARRGFEEAMDDDFNTPTALRHLFGLARAIHKGQEGGASRSHIQAGAKELRELVELLGIGVEGAQKLDAGEVLATSSVLLTLMGETWQKLIIKAKEGGLDPRLDAELDRLARSSGMATSEAARLLMNLTTTTSATQAGFQEEIRREAGSFRSHPKVLRDGIQELARTVRESKGQLENRRIDADEARPLIDSLLEARGALRKLGEFETADEVRRALERDNILLEDGVGGTQWRAS